MKTSAGINGLGRFGLHLLQYWIVHYDEMLFDIAYVNDDFLSLQDIQKIVANDEYLRLKQYLHFSAGQITVTLSNNLTVCITFTSSPHADIPWLGEPILFFECSGKHTAKKDWDHILKGQTQRALISATSWTADKIVVYGYNHKETLKAHKVLSYGSCTINAYVPLAQWVNDNLTVIESDVQVIHNTPAHLFSDFNTMERRDCTLSVAAPHLLSFINTNNFNVTYTLVPYTGVSLIDYRFKIKSSMQGDAVRAALLDATCNGALCDLYGTVTNDAGPAEHKFSRYSAVVVLPSVKRVGDNLYLQAYFDNENSVNRYADLANYLVLEAVS